MMGNGGIGNWELARAGNWELGKQGIGHWEEEWIIDMFSLRDYQLPITNYQLPIKLFYV
ncbi:hypothetical protein QT995_01405 [Microcoleus sp. S36b_A3]|uniref:hypothetical protein n=1 Tax=unclassified Microcoleus TaxID=2642155 RepID=UPI002FD00B9E